MKADQSYTEREGSQFWEYPDLGFSIEFRDASHRWWLHEQDKRDAVVSVTQAIGVLEKPALYGWHEAAGAEGAAKLARMGELDGVTDEDAILRVREFHFGAEAKRDAAATRGTIVHRVLEAYARDGRPPNITDFEAHIRGYVSGLCSWLLDHSPEPIAVEQAVASRLHRFAGRLDLLAYGPAGTELWDLKTSPTATIYPEAHLQATAYEAAALECGFDPDAVFLLAVGEDGTYTTTGCRAVPDNFLAVLEVSRMMSRLRGDMKAFKDV